MNADQLLDLLQKRGLLAKNVVTHLRRQVADSDRPVLPQRILKRLVDNGHLTEYQAKRLLREVATTKAEPTTAAWPPPQEKPAEDDSESPPPDEEELGLVPLPEDDGRRPAAKKKDPPATAPAPPPKPRRPAPKPPSPTTARPSDVPSAKAPQQPTRTGAATKPAELKKEAAAGKAAETPSPREESVPATAPVDEASAVGDKPSAAKPDGGSSPLSDDVADLWGDDLLERDDLSAGTALLPAKKPKRWFGLFGRTAADKKTKSGTWDSPLILIGSGALILLLVVGAFLFLFMLRGSGDQRFQEAEASYEGQAYAQAIANYDRFLRYHPSHRNASYARVRRGLAQLRLAVKDEAGTEQALAESKRVLRTISGEGAFDRAYPELASILPAIARDFADQARAATSSDDRRHWLERTHDALELVNNPTYLPTSAREGILGSIVAIEENVDFVEDQLRRDERLDETVQTIEQAVGEGATERAYDARDTLLSEYPSLEGDARLQTAVLSVTAKMGEQVRVGPPEPAVLTDDLPAPQGKSVVLFHTQAEDAAPPSGNPLFLMASGAVYAVDAATGAVAWRRPVGFQPNTHVQPVSNAPRADAILVDGSRRELQRLSAGDGSPIWRLPMDDRVVGVRSTDDHLVIAEQGGRVLLSDPDSGRTLRQAVLPQGIAARAGADDAQQALLVAGDHSNVYVLDAASLACRDVVYVGHKPECVRVPPVACLSHVLVFENAGLDFALVHVLAPGEDGAPWRTVQKPLRIAHNVVVEPVTTGPTITALTDRGALHLFEVNPADKDRPVREVASTQGNAEQLVAGSLAVDGGYLWVADNQLTRYRMNLSLGQIERTWADYPGDAFLACVVREGNVVLHARQIRGLPGVTVGALQVAGGVGDDVALSPRWSTDLAVPSAGVPILDPARQRVVSVSARGAAYSIDAAAIESGRRADVEFRLGPTAPLFQTTDSVSLAGERWAFADASGIPRWLYFDPDSPTTPFVLAGLDLPDTATTAAPVALGDHLLVPLDNGQVHLLDPASGEQASLPFQPSLTPGQRMAWRRPAVLADGRQFVIADGDGNLYRVGMEPAEPPLLKAQASARVSGRIVSALAVLGNSVFAVVAEEHRRQLVALDSQDLRTVATAELIGQVTLEPVAVGPWLILATDEEGLLAWNEAGERMWTVPLAGGIPTGPPVPLADGFCLVTTDGRLRRLAADGNLLAEVDSGEPIAAGPVVQGNNLLVSACDGTLRILPLPEKPQGGLQPQPRRPGVEREQRLYAR